MTSVISSDIASSGFVGSTSIYVMWPLVPVVGGYSTVIRVLLLCMTGSRPSCSTSENTVSPSAPGHSLQSVCLDRSHLLEQRLLKILLVNTEKRDSMFKGQSWSTGTLLWCIWDQVLKYCISCIKHSCLLTYLSALLDSCGSHSSVWLLASGQSCSCGPWLPDPPPGNTWLLEPERRAHTSSCTVGVRETDEWRKFNPIQFGLPRQRK